MGAAPGPSWGAEPGLGCLLARLSIGLASSFFSSSLPPSLPSTHPLLVLEGLFSQQKHHHPHLLLACSENRIGS